MKRQTIFTAASAFVAAAILATPSSASKLAEFMFWNSIGNQVDSAVRNHNAYRAERRKWRNNIARAERWYRDCDGCAAAKAELEKWKGVENQFQDVAGALAQAAGMPPIVADWLDIDLPITSGVAGEAQLSDVRWLADRPEFCQAPVKAHMDCLASWQADRQQRGLKTIDYDAAESFGSACFKTHAPFKHCANEDYEALEREYRFRELRRQGLIVPQIFADENVVYLAAVPDSFVPEAPPRDTMQEILGPDGEAPGTTGLTFLMEKAGDDVLQEFAIRPLHHTLVMPTNRCFEGTGYEDEIERRLCEDLYWTGVVDRSPVLTCYYGRKQALAARIRHDFAFWYEDVPDFYDPAMFLGRVPGHPVVSRIAAPRARCPATRAAAKDAIDDWARAWAQIDVIPVPPTTVAVKPAAYAAYERRREEERQARSVPSAEDVVGWYKASILSGCYRQMNWYPAQQEIGRAHD